jgi:tetratricopeptide (TPR) repeat protein
MLGLCQYRLKDYDRAYESLQQGRALGMPPDTQLNTVSRYHLALLLNRAGKPESALQLLYALARKSEGERPSIITAMGISALATSHLPEELPPDRVDLVMRAGRVQYLAATRQMAEARKSAEELIAAYPRTTNVHYAYGVFLLVEDPDAALDEFRREIDVTPAHVNARLQIAFEYIRRTDFEKGQPFAAEAVKLAPDSFAARNAYGRILLEVSSTEEAIRELEAGIKLAPNSPETVFALSRAYAKAGRKDDAARIRTEFRRLDRLRRTAREGSQAVGGIDPEARPTAEAQSSQRNP